MKVLVIGHQEAVLGFSLVGIEGKVTSTAEEANRALDEALTRDDVGIILVTHDIAQFIEPRMDQLKIRSTIPLVIEIPGPEGVGSGEPSLSDVVLRAIGVKI
jgi:V/A-type H+-transporting ATPase subunit F